MIDLRLANSFLLVLFLHICMWQVFHMLFVVDNIDNSSLSAVMRVVLIFL